MYVYFARSILGATRADVDLIAIENAILGLGHWLQFELIFEAAPSIPPDMFIRLRDLRWIDRCNVMIAEVSSPSLGVGYEIAYAEFYKKPTLMIAKRGSRVSAMLQGKEGGVSFYDDLPHLRNWILSPFLNGVVLP